MSIIRKSTTGEFLVQKKLGLKKKRLNKLFQVFQFFSTFVIIILNNNKKKNMLEVLGIEKTVLGATTDLAQISSSLQSISDSMNLIVVLLAVTVIIKGLKRLNEYINS